MPEVNDIVLLLFLCLSTGNIKVNNRGLKFGYFTYPVGPVLVGLDGVRYDWLSPDTKQVASSPITNLRSVLIKGVNIIKVYGNYM